MPRNNRYNPSPAEREAQRRGLSQPGQRAQSNQPEVGLDPCWRSLTLEDMRQPWGRIERADFYTSEYQQRGTQAVTEAALHDSIADTWRYWGATATEARMRREAAERQLRGIELRNQIERAVDRIQAGFRRPGDRVRLHVQQPFSLHQDPTEIPPARTVEVEIDRAGRPYVPDALIQEYRRLTDSAALQSAYPVALKRRNRQPDGSLLDLTQPAEATL